MVPRFRVVFYAAKEANKLRVEIGGKRHDLDPNMKQQPLPEQLVTDINETFYKVFHIWVLKKFMRRWKMYPCLTFLMSRFVAAVEGATVVHISSRNCYRNCFRYNNYK